MFQWWKIVHFYTGITIIIVKTLDLEIWINFHVLDRPKPEKSILKLFYGVSEHNKSKT